MQSFVREHQMIANQCFFFKCVHTCSKINNTSDILSKYSHRKDIMQHTYTHNQLTHIEKGSYILEKMGVHNFRGKKLRRIKKPP